MKLKQVILACVAMLTLASCSNQEGGAQTAGGLFVQFILSERNRGDAVPDTFDIETSVTQEQVAEIPAPMVVIYLPGRQSWGSLQEVSRNGANQTFISSDAIALTLQNGVLVSSRGFDYDLLASEPSTTLSALRGNTGNYTRVMRFLTPLSAVEVRQFTCSAQAAGRENIVIAYVSHNTRRINETCSDGVVEYVNSYWLDQRNIIRKSRQWISQEMGQIDIYTLKL